MYNRSACAILCLPSGQQLQAFFRDVRTAVPTTKDPLAPKPAASGYHTRGRICGNSTDRAQTLFALNSNDYQYMPNHDIFVKGIRFCQWHPISKPWDTFALARVILLSVTVASPRRTTVAVVPETPGVFDAVARRRDQQRARRKPNRETSAHTFATSLARAFDSCKSRVKGVPKLTSN